MLRLTFEGAHVHELAGHEPAASVRLLVPSPGATELVIPTWNGNEFLLPDGSRPALRTFTPLRVDPDGGRIDLEIVRHPGGAVSTWAEDAGPGSPAAISGPGSGYVPDQRAARFVLLGDETALPAISQLVEMLPTDAPLEIHVEVTSEDARIELPQRDGCELTWYVTPSDELPGTGLVDVIRGVTAVDDHTRIWAAGEAASMQAIRAHLFKTLGIPRSQASVRGYWKPARSAGSSPATAMIGP